MVGNHEKISSFSTCISNDRRGNGRARRRGRLLLDCRIQIHLPRSVVVEQQESEC